MTAVKTLGLHVPTANSEVTRSADSCTQQSERSRMLLSAVIAHEARVEASKSVGADRQQRLRQPRMLFRKQPERMAIRSLQCLPFCHAAMSHLQAPSAGADHRVYGETLQDRRVFVADERCTSRSGCCEVAQHLVRIVSVFYATLRIEQQNLIEHE